MFKITDVFGYHLPDDNPGLKVVVLAYMKYCSS